MDAKQAKELANQKKKSLDDIMASIKTMANAGHQYCVTDLAQLRDPEAYKAKLESLGYKVIVNEKFFEVNW